MAQETPTLEAEPREQLGTRAARRLRRDGRLPAVIYGHGERNASVTLPLKQTADALHHGAQLLSLKLAAGDEQVLVKDVQYNHLGDEILHLDLFRVNLDEEITTEVPIVLVGEPRGALEGGILTQMRDAIEIVVRVRDLPDDVRVSVADLGVGDSIHVSDVQLPPGATLPAHEGETADYTIAMVAAKKIRAEDEEVEPETGEEPEIIGDKQTAVQPGEDAPADPNA